LPPLAGKLPFLATATAAVLLGSVWGLKEANLEKVRESRSNSHNLAYAESQQHQWHSFESPDY